MEQAASKHLPPPGQVTIVDPHVPVTLPVLKYGYRTTPASWNELVRIVAMENDIPKLSRSKQQQHEYEVFRHYMKEQYISTMDYILISKFGVEAVEEDAEDTANDSTQKSKWKAKHSLAEMETSIAKLIPNDFPYFNESGIEHYIYWKTKEPIADQEIDQVKVELRQRIGAADILFWVNPPALQSIPDIVHVHFLFRRKT